MSSYYKFDFEQHLNIDLDSFLVQQEELFLLENDNQGAKFKKINIKYECKFIKQEKWNNDSPTIFIPIKDNIDLLKVTISNLKQFNIDKYCNIIIIDDRSSEKEIEKACLKENFSYLRIDNPKGFNFSMLNNIAALISYKLKNNTVIMWNSDLWTNSEETLKGLLKEHFKENSFISGTKLIYPPKEMTFHKDDNLSEFFKQNVERYEKIQFGGSNWVVTSGPIRFSPSHWRRFKNKNDILSTCNKTETFITGAFQIINLEWFISVGGFNPSLAKNFQDVDLCLKALEEGKKISYFGKDFFLYHDESISLEKEGKYDNQLLSDHILFGKIWNNRISELIF